MKAAAYLALAVATGCACAQNPPPSNGELNRKVDTVLERAYRLPAVARFCEANPESVYLVEIDGVTVAVRCAAWREWRDKQ